MEQGRWPGTWKVACDICGFWFPSDKVRKRWDNAIVCHADFEQKHPQLSIRIPKEEIGVPFARPDPTDTFVTVCPLWGIGGYADLGTADCAQADKIVPSYLFLTQLKADSERVF